MSVTLNFKTDEKLKKEAQKIAKEIGLPLGTIMNHSLREFVRDRKVVFTDHPMPSRKVVEEMKKMSEDARLGRNVSPRFKTTKEAVAWLNS